MDNYLNIPDLRPLTPEEELALKEFKAHMETMVIPELIQRDFENRQRAMESRKWFVD